MAVGGAQSRFEAKSTSVLPDLRPTRLDLAQKYAAKHGAFAKTGDPAKDFRFLWVTDFPMFEWDGETGRWNAAHHPFTSLHDEDMAKLETSFDSTATPSLRWAKSARWLMTWC